MMYNRVTGAPIGGVAKSKPGLFRNWGSSVIYISPAIKGFSENGIGASQYVVNHEIIHAYHYKLYYQGKITKSQLGYSESIASGYNLAYANTHGLTSQNKGFRARISNLTERPSIMSWRNLSNLLQLK